MTFKHNFKKVLSATAFAAALVAAPAANVSAATTTQVLPNNQQLQLVKTNTAKTRPQPV